MRPKLLVVDDEEPILFALRDYFTSRAFKVDCVKTAEEARILFEADGYAVVIVDLSLASAGHEGLEIAGHIRERHPKTAVIILTAYGSPQAEAEARRLGVAAFLHKPQSLGTIAKIIDDLIALRRD